MMQILAAPWVIIGNPLLACLLVITRTILTCFYKVVVNIEGHVKNMDYFKGCVNH